MRLAADPLFQRTWHRIVGCFVLGVVAAASSVPAAEWRLTFDVVREESPLPGANAATTSEANKQAPNLAKHETREYATTISLGEKYLVVEAEGRRTIYDFRTKRIIECQLEKNVYRETSLYSDVAFRVIEAQNHQSIGEALLAAKVLDAGKAFERFDTETLFSIELPRGRAAPPVRIDRAEREGECRFLHGETLVVQFKPAVTRIPDPYYTMFARWLAYQCRMHPSVRRQIVQSGKIPETLLWRSDDVAVRTTTTYRLQSATRTSEHGDVLPPNAGFEDDPDDELVRLLARLGKEGTESTRPTREEAVKFAEKAAAGGNPLDGLLALIEHVLQTGDPLADEMRRMAPHVCEDEACRRFFAGSDQSSEEACRKSLASYDSIDRTKLAKVHVLDIHRANLMAQIGDVQEAEKTFLAVLAVNPYVTGVYKDLGDLYYRTYQTQRAWLCWDTARRLYPQHRMLKAVTALEQRFAKDFPDFF